MSSELLEDPGAHASSPPQERIVRPRPRWPVGLSYRAVDHVTVVFSDIEMGAGGIEDDFPASDWLGDLVLGYSEGPFRDVDVTIVFNGDTFDLLKTSIDGEYPTHIDASVASSKFERVARAHRGFFRALCHFLESGPGARRVVFLVGNHDQDLLFEEVQAAIVAEIGQKHRDRVRFPGLHFTLGDLHVEHGSQRDPLFAIEPEEPFVELDGRTLLNLPWGSVALLEVAIPLTPVLYHHDRLKPREELLELMPEMRDLLLGAFWRYWTRDYWQEYFAASDPLRRVSWTMLKEIVYRFGSRVMDVSVGRAYREMVRGRDDVQVCVIGHQHEAAWWTIGPKKVLRTSCFRNEFAIRDGGKRQTLLPKVYAEIYSAGGSAVRSHLVEIDGPPPPAESIPESIFDVTEALREALHQRRLAESVEEDRKAREAQEAREAREKTRGSGGEVWRSLRRALRQKR